MTRVLQSQPRTSTTTVEKAYLAIRNLISTNELMPGDRIPSEKELVEQIDISRSSLREALSRLEQEGVLTAVHGQGRFISSLSALQVERPMTKYESITEMLEALGYEVSTAVLDVSETEATPVVAAALNIEVGTPLIRLLRLRHGDDTPLVVSENLIPKDLLPGPIGYRNWSGSIYAMLAAHGSRIESALATISATNIPKEWDELYNLGGLDPWLMVNEVGLTKSGKPVLYAFDYHKSPEITFTVLRQR